MEINFPKYQLKVGHSDLKTRSLLILSVTALPAYVTKLITGCSSFLKDCNNTSQ